MCDVHYAAMAAVTRDTALEVVLNALTRGETRHFHLGVAGYYIEGMPYGADALTLSQETTLNLTLTQDGVVCRTFFPPALLEETIVRSNGVSRSEAGVDLVAVTLEVKRQDVWLIAEFVNGVQEHLFLDPDALLIRKLALFKKWPRGAAGEPRVH